MSILEAAMKKYKFKAEIIAGMGGGAGVLFPYDVEDEFGTKGSVPVQATLDGVAYRGSLMNCGMASHTLGVLKGIREQIGKGPGDTIDGWCGKTKKNARWKCRRSSRSCSERQSCGRHLKN
jgi:hypothetical protein